MTNTTFNTGHMNAGKEVLSGCSACNTAVIALQPCTVADI